MLHLLRVIDDAPESDCQITLHGDRSMVGRHVTADIPLFNATVNKYHAVLTRTDAGYTVEDWNSRSGTFVNGVRVVESMLLKDSDSIAMGTVKLTYHQTTVQERIATDKVIN